MKGIPGEVNSRNSKSAWDLGGIAVRVTPGQTKNDTDEMLVCMWVYETYIRRLKRTTKGRFFFSQMKVYARMLQSD